MPLGVGTCSTTPIPLVPKGPLQDYMPNYKIWNKIYVRTTGSSGVTLVLIEKIDASASV